MNVRVRPTMGGKEIKQVEWQDFKMPYGPATWTLPFQSASFFRRRSRHFDIDGVLVQIGEDPVKVTLDLELSRRCKGFSGDLFTLVELSGFRGVR